MFGIKVALLLVLISSLELNIVLSHNFVSSQIFTVESNSSNINFSTRHKLDSDNTTVSSLNTSGIMRNTSGMLDDAFEALKDSIGSFFGN